jgi:hypothetical protein
MLDAQSDKLAKRGPSRSAPLSGGTGVQCTPYKIRVNPGKSASNKQ